jgi:TRAP-type C4-dicarboxylate transport system substrate-binding protein
MNILKVVSLIGVLSALLLNSSFSLVIKLGSIAPEQTPWGEAINRMASDWSRISGGTIELKVYHNGIAGSESDMLRKMRIGQLQAGVFTSFGLNEISPDILSLSIPFLIRTEGELDYVLKKLQPVLEKKIEAKKYKVIAWSRVGWVRFFSKKPVVYPKDLKAQKMASNPDDEALIQAWKVLGYPQVPVAVPDILSSLNSGMIEAIYASPIAVGGFQWFGLARYMSDFKISPFMGGIVMSQSVWEKIPENLRPELMKSVRAFESELVKNVRDMEEEAIKTMQTYGLIIAPAPKDAEAEWKGELNRGINNMLGKSFSKEMYLLINKYLEEYRSKK